MNSARQFQGTFAIPAARNLPFAHLRQMTDGAIVYQVSAPVMTPTEMQAHSKGERYMGGTNFARRIDSYLAPFYKDRGVAEGIMRDMFSEINSLHKAIAEAHKYLQSATPRQRNGPCFQAVGVLQRAVPELPHDNRCKWVIDGRPEELEGNNCTCGKIERLTTLQDVMHEALAKMQPEQITTAP